GPPGSGCTTDEADRRARSADESVVGFFAARRTGLRLRGIFAAVFVDGFDEFEDGGSDAGGTAEVYSAVVGVAQLRGYFPASNLPRVALYAEYADHRHFGGDGDNAFERVRGVRLCADSVSWKRRAVRDHAGDDHDSVSRHDAFDVSSIQVDG